MSSLMIALVIGIVVFIAGHAFTDDKAKQICLFGLIICAALFILFILIQVLGQANITG